MRNLLIVISLILAFTVQSFSQGQLNIYTTKDKITNLLDEQEKLRESDLDSALVLAQYTLDQAEFLSDTLIKAEVRYAYAHTARDLGYNSIAAKYFQLAGDMYVLAGNFDLAAAAYSDLSYALDVLGKYPEALKASQQSLYFYREIEDISGQAYCYNDIGVIHYYLSNFDLSLDYYNRAFELYKKDNDTTGMGIYYNNVANIYGDQDEIEKALEYYQKAYELDVALNKIDGQSITLSNIGETYTYIGEYKKGEEYLLKALQLAEETNDPWMMTNPLRGLADLYTQQKKYTKAIEITQRSVELAKSIDALYELSSSIGILADLYGKQKDYEKAFEYHTKYLQLKDSLFNIENKKIITEHESQYQLSEKSEQIALLEKQNEITALREREKEIELEQERSKFWIIGGASLLLLIITILVLIGFIMKRKSERRMSLQKSMIEEKNKEILDSIGYAKRLQDAILPKEKDMQEVMKDFFVYYRPKDIVAGDFYWLEEQDDNIFIACADCTGHGVPGAMVSVVCSNALNKAIVEMNISDPAEILEETRRIVIERFQSKEDDVKDGMDISLLVYNKKDGSLKMAAANSRIWIIKSESKELKEYRGDKQPVASYAFEHPFSTQSIDYQKGDTVYMFSDGIIDQFGGSKLKKLKTVGFAQWVENIQGKSFKEQSEEIDIRLTEWKGSVEQIDDICVIGLRF